MDSLLSVGTAVVVRPRSHGLARYYFDAQGEVIEVNEAARLYVVSFCDDPEGWKEVRLILTEEEVDPLG